MVFVIFLGASATHAQLPKHVERCLPYPTYAEEVAGMYADVGLKSAAPKKVVIIDSVDLEGLVTLPAQNQQKLIDDLKQLELDAGSQWLEELEEDPIRGAWQDDGYFEALAHATSKVVGRDALGEHVALTVRVDEGLQYFQGTVQFASSDPDSPLAFSSEELRNLYPLREGDVFNADKIRGSLDAYRQLYGARGYIDFSSVPEFDVDDKTRRVNLRIEMDQQKQFRIDKVEVSGLDPGMEGLLRSRVKSGDLFNSDLIHQFFDENQSALPPDASPRENLSVEKNVKAATASLRFDFFTCPNPAN
jgi:Surface antigen variable number repeat